jgi:hypothetical protein
MISTKTFAGRLVALAILAGCADPRLGPNGKRGWVVQVYTPAALLANRPSCLASITSEQISSRQYAEIRVSHLGSYKHVSAYVPGSIRLRPHDQVEISPSSCHDGVIPEVIKVLERSSLAPPAD